MRPACGTRPRTFLQRAFTIIFVATIVIWFLQTFDLQLNVVSRLSATAFWRIIGGRHCPDVRAAWFWRLAAYPTALITGFMAKESVVSTLNILFAGTEGVLAALSVPAAAALLVFCLLYSPCVAAVASIKRELGGKWAAGVVVFQCAVAHGSVHWLYM